MKVLRTLFLLLVLTCSVRAAEITVSAAASLKDCLNEIIAIYEKDNAGTKIVPNYAASGTLAKQIENGAPADVFISADKQRMTYLAEKKLLVTGTQKQLLLNKVVLIVPKGKNSPITSFADLGTDMLKEQRLAIGDPKSVPAGTYAMEIFKTLNIVDKVIPKIVYGNTVRAVLTYTAQNEVDAGVVYLTDAILMKDKVTVVAEAPANSHTPVIYPAAVTKTGSNLEGGKTFLQFLTSEKSKKVFVKYGFGLVTK
ncbi:MAG: molybdate ABC transporter substrate-binding protein [Planctomycetaceae bacterium]|jgi:molybdate transport system substrate-binding protein|nr:molybdate ABC transporter substrate-binding protein [Planctomycetaceae bacterium]